VVSTSSGLRWRRGHGGRPCDVQRPGGRDDLLRSATTEARLGEADVYTCQSFVADAGEAYGWLTTFERTGSISGELTTPGNLEVYQIGGTASIYTDQLQSTDLRAAMRSVEEEGMALRAEIDAQGSVSPTPLRQAWTRPLMYAKRAAS